MTRKNKHFLIYEKKKSFGCLQSRDSFVNEGEEGEKRFCAGDEERVRSFKLRWARLLAKRKCTASRGAAISAAF